ncbi:hypothetical protein [Paenibacillus sp. NPDC055715]
MKNFHWCIGIILIAEWVLRKACPQNKRWQKVEYHLIPIYVNLSIRLFQQKKLVDVSRGTLA